MVIFKVCKYAKIKNRYNQVPHPTHDTTRESDENTTKHHAQESQEVSPFPSGVHNAAFNRQELKHDKHETYIAKMNHKRSTALELSVKKIFYWRTAPTSPLVQMWIKTHR